MRNQSLTLHQLTALSNKDILNKVKRKASQFRSLDKSRKLTNAEYVAYNRVLSILHLYEVTFSEEKGCK